MIHVGVARVQEAVVVMRRVRRAHDGEDEVAIGAAAPGAYPRLHLVFQILLYHQRLDHEIDL